MKFSACQSCVIQALLLEKIGETSLAMEYIVYCLDQSWPSMFMDTC
jgi:hypothetical protein